METRNGFMHVPKQSSKLKTSSICLNTPTQSYTAAAHRAIDGTARPSGRVPANRPGREAEGNSSSASSVLSSSCSDSLPAQEIDGFGNGMRGRMPGVLLQTF